MNFLDFFKSSSATRQLLLAGVISLTLAGLLAGAYLGLFQTHYDVLFSGLRDVDAATIVAELDKEKTPYELKDGGATILVPTELVAKTRLNLMSTSLPLKGTVGFELFSKSDMGLTEFAQQINYQRALQGELARTIMAMDGVDEARIHLALPEHAIFRDESKPPKASVSVLTRPGKSLSAGTIKGIQRLVAAAVPDLDVGNVVVLDGRGAVVSDAPPIIPTSSLADRKRGVEQAYETTIRAALLSSFAHRQIDVTVWAGITDGAVADTDAQGEPRNFPLRVSLSVSPPSTPAEEQAVRDVVFAAIHADPNRDVITYTVSALPTPSNVRPPAPPPRQVFGIGVIGAAITGGLILVLLAAALALQGRQTGGRRLTADQRADYAQRLKAALEGR